MDSVENGDSVRQHRPLSRLRVLVVDDNYDVLQATSMLLSFGGAEVVCAMSAPGAVEIIRKCSPDVVVTDILMPGQDGFELLRMARAEGYVGPVVALTALGAREFSQRAEAADFAFCLGKPIEPQTLIDAVRRAVLEG